jgi:RNA-directed DNA polymerase
MDWHEAKEEGPPQGGVSRPLLANLYLNPLDWLMAGGGFETVRYLLDIADRAKSFTCQRKGGRIILATDGSATS